MLKKAVILAGGKGTRLQNVRKDIPKPMMPLAGKPLLHHLILWCKKEGIEQIYITVNHLKDSIISYFGQGEKFGLHIHYYEETEPLGTVGGVKALENELQEDFLILYGDVMLNICLEKLYQFHKKNQSTATLVVHPNDHPYDSDLLDVDKNDRVIDFLPKPHTEGSWHRNLVNAATYVFSPSIFPFLPAGVKSDFGSDIFPQIINKTAVYAYNTPEYLKDMGTPERLQRVETDLLSGKIEARNLENKQKAIFLDRDGVINYDTDLIKHPDEFQLYPFAAEAIKKINRSGYLAIVVTNQSVLARGLTNEAGLAEIHKKMETLLGNEGAFVDAIYFCPHHPHGGFKGEVAELKIDCDCRKPKPGMLLQAAKRFNIDLALSWMIGDSERDVRAAHAAGVQIIGVKTGHGLKKSTTLPDYFMSDLADAVSYIFDEKVGQQSEAILQIVKSSKKRPFVICLGGNSRSGKSTLSQNLKNELTKQGLQTFIISLDDWILPKHLRPDEKGVFHNFNTEQLQSDVQRILAGERVRVEGYKRHPKREQIPVVYQLNSPQVIVIEGVIALSTEFFRTIADLKVFRKIDRITLKNRFTTFYLWKEFEHNEIERLFAIREKNEYDIIDQNIQFADIVVE